MSDHDLIEIAARTAFSHEQCDLRQARLLAYNWNQRLSDGDRAEYRALASAILSAVEPLIRDDERQRHTWTEAMIRADERERIASLLEDYGYGDAAQIARNGGSDE